MYGINAFSGILFAVINIAAVLLCKSTTAIRTKTIQVLCVSLLAFNLGRYLLSPILGYGLKIPVEFSTVAYFAVPFLLLTTKIQFRSWAAYSGLMAGFFYYMTMIIVGGPIYHAYPPYDIYISMLCHGALYFCGLVMISTKKCPSKDEYTLFIGIAYVTANALLFRPRMEGTERIFIYELLDGIYIRQFLPQTLWHIVLPIYYAVLASLVLLSFKGFYKLNFKLYNKTVHCQQRKPVSIPAH